MTDRRRKILRVSTPVFLDFFRGVKGYSVASDAVPADARVVDIQFSPRDETAWVLIESAAFDHAPEGELYPVLAPTFRLIPPGGD